MRTLRNILCHFGLCITRKVSNSPMGTYRECDNCGGRFL